MSTSFGQNVSNLGYDRILPKHPTSSTTAELRFGPTWACILPSMRNLVSDFRRGAGTLTSPFADSELMDRPGNDGNTTVPGVQKH